MNGSSSVWVAGLVVFPLISIGVDWLLRLLPVDLTSPTRGEVAPRWVYIVLVAAPPLATAAFASIRRFRWWEVALLTVLDLVSLVVLYFVVLYAAYFIDGLTRR
jgi:hypothetical protein